MYHQAGSHIHERVLSTYMYMYSQNAFWYMAILKEDYRRFLLLLFSSFNMNLNNWTCFSLEVKLCVLNGITGESLTLFYCSSVST